MDDKATENVKVETPEVEKIENEAKPVDHVKDKKRNRDERGKKKDDNKPAEQVLKTLTYVQSVEEKLKVMCEKYSEMVNENRKLQLALKQYEKRILMLQREKEQFQAERSKSVLTRRRLENLCRELQKQNRAVKEESLQKIREEEERRKEVTATFQSTLAEITALMNQSIEKNAQMHEENLEMNKKFKSVYEQVEVKEQQLLRVHQQVKLDLQLAHAKLAKVKMEGTAEKEALLKEKQRLLFKLSEYQEQIRELQATEVALRSQISMYTDKYDEFQNALNRSNKIYGEFNEEMEKMSKKILTLEKETSLWKQRWENSHTALLEMAADKQIRDSEMATLSKKLSLLQDLCKMFQRERTSLIAQLKEKNGASQSETSSATTSAPSAAEVPETIDATVEELKEQSIHSDQTEVEENIKSIKQVDALSKDCLTLQNTFGQLQASLSKVSEDIEKGLKEDCSSSEMVQQNNETQSGKEPEVPVCEIVTETNNLESEDNPKEESSKSDTANDSKEQKESEEMKDDLLNNEASEAGKDLLKQNEETVKSELNQSIESCKAEDISIDDPLCKESGFTSENIELDKDSVALIVEVDPQELCKGEAQELKEETSPQEINVNVENRRNQSELSETEKQATVEVPPNVTNTSQEDSHTVQNITETDDKETNERLIKDEIVNCCTAEKLPDVVNENNFEVENVVTPEVTNADVNLASDDTCTNNINTIVPDIKSSTEAIIEDPNLTLSENVDACSMKGETLLKDSADRNMSVQNAVETKTNNSTVVVKNGKRKKK